MANRHWVGGTAAWNATAGTKWALTNGGVGGQAAPTSSDNVFFDSGSGASVVTIDASYDAMMADIDCTGFTGTLTGGATSSIQVYGNLKFVSTMIWTDTNTQTVLRGKGAQTFTSGGKSFTNSISHNESGPGVTGSYTLQDSLTSTGSLTVSAGEFKLNDKSVSVASISTGASGTLTMGASTLTLSGTGTILNFTNITALNANTSTIIISDVSSSSKTFTGAGRTYNNVTVPSGGSGAVIFTGANTFTPLVINGPKSVTFPAATTTTCTSLVLAGSLGNIITIVSSSSGSAATLSQLSGVVAGNFLSLKDSTVTGGATFNANHSTSVSGNTGWNFLTTPASVNGIMAFFE